MKNFKIESEYIATTEDKIEITVPINLKNIKIIESILNVKVNSVTPENSNFQVDFESIKDSNSDKKWSYVDYIKNVKSSDILKINISDELQTVIDSEATALVLHFKCDEAHITFDNSSSDFIDIDYISLEEYQNNGSNNEIDLNKSGTAKINLATGKLNIDVPLISSDENVLPISINAKYNSVKNDNLPDIGLPHHWSLDVNQFLIKNETEADKLSFTYINDSGKSQIIEEKYFYKDENNKKVYVTRDELSVDLDGNLKFGNKTVETSLETPLGIKLVSSIEDIPGSELTDYEPEELINVKQQIKSIEDTVEELENNISQNKKQLCVMALTKQMITKQLESQEKFVLDTEAQLSLQRTVETIRKKATLSNRYYRVNTNDSNDGINIKSDGKSESNPSEYNVDNADAKSKLGSGEISQQTLTELANDNNFTDQSHIVQGTIVANESSIIYTFGYPEDNIPGTLTTQEDNNELNKLLYCNEIDEQSFEEYVSSVISDEDNIDINYAETWESFKHEINNIEKLTLGYKDLISIDLQIESLKYYIKTYKERTDNYNDELLKLNHQKEQYEMQVPVHYLYNEDNIIYGFGKTSDKNIFRLVLITDVYENSIYFTYESPDSNKLESIIDTEEKSITFSYEDDLLSTITDSRDRQVKFVYENNDLHCITHVDKTKSYYYYSTSVANNEVDDKNLTAVMNQTGLGALFEYSDNKVTKVTALSILNDVTNGKISYKRVEDGIITTTDSFDFDALDSATLQSCEEYKNLKESTTFEYSNCKSTTITNNKKSVTYIFDKEGKVRTIYENGFDENNTNSNQINFHAKDFSYQDNKISMTATPLTYSQNYLSDRVFKEDAKTVQYGFYLGEDDSVCSSMTVPFSYEVNAKYYSISNSESVKKATISMSSDNINLLNSDLASNDPQDEICLHRTFVVSGWAKAENASFTLTDEIQKDENGNDIYADYIKNRKFEINVKVKYATASESEEDVETFSRPFDWRNTEWQYCALAFTLKYKTIQSIECSVDFSENTGDIIFTDLDFRQADFEVTEYDANKRPVKSFSAHSNFETIYEYEDEETTRPCKQIVRDKFDISKVYETTFEYTKAGKLLRSIDHNEIVTENVYNQRGVVTKTMTYHKDEPTSKFYDEKKLDDKGKETASVNELGEETSTYEYIDGTGILSSSTDENGVKTAYGYSLDDTLLETSISANGIENTNTYGYTLDFLTSLKHNDFEIGYDYDNQGRTKQINVAGKMYLTKTYGENEETTALNSNETYRQTFNDNGDVLETFYKKDANSQETKLVENIYDSYGNIIKTKDYADKSETTDSNEHSYFYDKFGNTVKETNNQHGKAIVIENEMDENHSNVTKTTIKIGDDLFTYEYDRAQTPDATLNVVTLPNGIEQTLAYDKLHRVKCIQTEDFNKHFSYLKNGDHATNLVSKIQFAIRDASKGNLTYKYDKKGNITEIRENNLLLARYQYDALSRIIREDNAKLKKTFAYSYDAGGNITQRLEYAFTLVENLDFVEPTASFSYSYSLNGWKDQLIDYNGETFVYDSLGNPTTYRGKSLVWSHGRQLSKFADIAEYKYNASGIRTSKIANGFTTSYFLNGNKILMQHDATNTFTFYYAADGITGFHLKNNVVDKDFYYKKNAQNDIIGIYMAGQKEIARYEYDAWGNCVAKYLQDDGTYAIINDDYSYNDTTIINRFIAFKNPFRFRSYYYDFETNLYYLNSRYYDPEIGRFINADDISTLDITQIALNGLNLYAYCLNNPVNEVDDDGNMPWWLKLLIGLAFIIGGALVTAFTAGTGAVFWSALGSALLTSVIQTGISTAISAGIGLVVGGITSGSWEGALNGLVNGAIDGFMWGGIVSGGSQILGKLIPKTSGFKIGKHEFMYGTDKSKTLLSFNNKFGSSRFRIDIGPGTKTTKLFYGLHLHFGSTSKIRSLHRFIFPAIINGLLTGIGSVLKKYLRKS